MFIDGKHAVGIAIEGCTQVGAFSRTFFCKSAMFSGSIGLAGWCGKVAIKLKVERDEFARQVLKDMRHNHTSHAIAGVNHDFERLDLAHIDEREGVLHIIIGDIALDDLSFVRQVR